MLDSWLRHFLRLPFVVEENKLKHLREVEFLRAGAIVFVWQHFSCFVQQLAPRHVHL